MGCLKTPNPGASAVSRQTGERGNLQFIGVNEDSPSQSEIPPSILRHFPIEELIPGGAND